MTTNINNSNTAIKITKLKKIYNNNKSDPVYKIKKQNVGIFRIHFNNNFR